MPLAVLKTVGQGILPDGVVEMAARFRTLTSASGTLDDSVVGEVMNAGVEVVDAVQKALTCAALT